MELCVLAQLFGHIRVVGEAELPIDEDAFSTEKQGPLYIASDLKLSEEFLIEFWAR